MSKRGHPPHVSTPKEEARWAAWELKCRTTQEANRRLRQERNRTIYLMRSQGMKWEVIASLASLRSMRSLEHESTT